MQLTEEFKSQMREFLATAFEYKSEILCNPYSLQNDLSFDESFSTIRIPIFANKKLREFFISEGLTLRDSRLGLYTISPVF